VWARHMELTLGLWLLVSPFVLRHDAGRSFAWIHDLATGAAIVVIALACHWRPLERAHLALLAVAAWLIGLGWWRSWQSEGIHPDATFQNWLLLGLLLGMFALVPSESSRPPRPWRRDAAPPGGHAVRSRLGR